MARIKPICLVQPVTSCTELLEEVYRLLLPTDEFELLNVYSDLRGICDSSILSPETLRSFDGYRTPLNVGDWEPIVQRFVIKVSDITEDILPDIIITPDKKWHEKPDDQWQVYAMEVLREYADYWAVCLEISILGDI